MIKRILFIFPLMIQCILANEPKEVGKFGSWTAYKYKDKKSDVCYLTNTPEKSEGKYKARGKIYMMISVRSDSKKMGEFSHIAGYAFGNDEKAKVTIGNKNFTLFTSDDTAWAFTDTDDTQLIEKMLKETSMKIEGKSNKGTETVDTYSLKELDKGLKKIRSECGLK